MDSWHYPTANHRFTKATTILNKYSKDGQVLLSFQILLSTIGPVSILVMLIVFSEFSRRLAVVVRAKPFHRGFYVAAGFVAIGLAYRLLNVGQPTSYFNISENPETASWYIVPIAMGLFTGIGVAWRYWGWLIYASEFGDM